MGKIIQKIKVPTGHIAILEAEHGRLEFLSIGDYGKDVNLKADFLGLGRRPAQVKHQEMLPLSEKWVVTISTQYGCSMECDFCDVPKVGPGRNATLADLWAQVRAGLSFHPEVQFSRRLNVHFARMGEPAFNPAVLQAAREFREELFPAFHVHPVVSTMCPCANRRLREFLIQWVKI